MVLTIMKKRLVTMTLMYGIISLLIGMSLLPYTITAEKDETGYKSSLGYIDGKILFAPMDTTKTYIIDNTGEVIHSWSSSFLPGVAVCWLGNGTILRTIRAGIGPGAGGAGGGVQKIAWDGTVLWDFRYNNNECLSHHDVKPLPNGNVLMIAYEKKTYAEGVAAGKTPSDVPSDGFFPDHIIEVQPTGPTSGMIVWEWHVWDHLIQDYDASKANYGVVKDHPELVDINYKIVMGYEYDWLHTNSIDYNEQFDQILLSIWSFSEIWVIDHSTTTTEAASHTGGKSGKGGDLLYRWGNPATYKTGTTSDQKLFNQHDATWIDEGCPGAGNILIFNNGVNRPDGKYSSVDEIIPPVNEQGEYTLTPGTAYGPTAQTWIYTANPPFNFYTSHFSGAERLTNGNTLICNGVEGKFFEVTPAGETVWMYTNSYPVLFANNVFKIVYIPPENNPPNTPSSPSGQIKGKIDVEYTYTSSTTDPDEDQIYYLWDWGDSTQSDWLGPNNSGDIIETTHTWADKGTYSVKVKAKDSNGLESSWSDPSLITMPYAYKPLWQFLELLFQRFPHAFPALRQMLGY
jgi:hypothetical protein